MNLIELVPHSLEPFEQDVLKLLRMFPELSGVNIPDVLRVPVRSHEAAAPLVKQGVNAIPHIRVGDRPLSDTHALVKDLVGLGLTHLLFVSGDKPEGLKVQYDVTPLMAIESVREMFPQLKIYAALDPYRTSIKEEIFYARLKLKAGAIGFFTQPFFYSELATIYLEQLADSEIFLGISPVTTEGSLSYWKNRNSAVFPAEFSLELSYNAGLALRLTELAHQFGQHTYHMPIKVSPVDYLNALRHQASLQADGIF